MLTQETINEMINAAISGDVLTGDGGGFVAIMAKNSPSIRQDIPVAFEMYTLLSHFLNRLPFLATQLSENKLDVTLTPSILHDHATGRVVALLPIRDGEISDVAYWLADGLPSGRVKQMAGILAIPFSIEEHDSTKHLLPEWFAAFYVAGDAHHCVPILALRSVISDQKFGGDWVDIALNRMTVFCLPNLDATIAVKTKK